MFTMLNVLKSQEQLKLSLSDFHNIQYLCDGKSPIYRLNAEFDNYQGMKLYQHPDKEKAIQGLIQALSKTSCPPDRVFVFNQFDLHVSAEWYPPFPLLLKDVEQYWTLIDNFVKYVGTFDFAKGQFNTGVFSDSPGELTEREKQFIRTFGVSVRINPMETLDFHRLSPKSSPQEITVVDARY
ncbi:hypothetical protein [Paenibacillus thalictri]|uniref:Uncharacterized protein n=1 Tax=Paenibacillus thalictri TaxID=2527873 RepID=A0A4Q9DSV3_9BACL|nr:hypothetical protein [Paenibacillus thalictri]TBL77422.1 hypothetical protein EYB31_18300 [Paenibacillus thalictri]